MVRLVHEYLLRTAEHDAAAAALSTAAEQVTWGDVEVRSAGVAAAFHEAGVRRGDRVLLFLENSVELVVAAFASLRAGAAFVPVNPTTKQAKLAYLLADAEPAAVVTQERLTPVFAAARRSSGFRGAVFGVGDGPAGAIPLRTSWEAGLPPPPPPALIDEDLAAIVYTSGSTGDAKGVMLTHRNITNTAWAISTYLGNVPDDVVLCGLPLSFDYGLFQVLTAARVGFQVILRPSLAFPWDVLRDVERHRVTGLPGVPTLWAMLLDLAPWDGVDLTSLRYLTNTAAAFPPAHIRRLASLLPAVRIFSMYGLTECTRVSYLEPERVLAKPGSVGRPIPNSEFWVAGPDGETLPPGEVGELMVRGAHVMRGYWRKPDATARRLVPGPHGERVLATGDLALLDADGDLYFIGRRDHVFKCRGEKVSPNEVEAVLHEIPGVAEARVVGVPHAVDGTAVKAVVVPTAGARLTDAAVRRYCRGHLESHLVPRFVEFRSALPRTPSGKVDVRALAATAGEQPAPGDQPAAERV